MKSPVNPILPLAAAIALAAYGEVGAKPAPPPPPPPPPANGPGSDYPVTIGAPFTIGDKTYTPIDRMNVDDVGYGWTDAAMTGGVTAAHKTLPLPSYAEVTSLITGRTILVRVTQRGPMDNESLVALSPDAAAQLGLDDARTPVRVRRVNPPEPERALLRAGGRAPDRMATPKALVDVLRRKLALPPLTPPPELTDSAAPPAPAKPIAVRPAPAASRITRLKPAAVDPKPAPPALAPTSTPAPPPAQPAEKPAPRAVAAAGSLVVQVATFSTKERADTAAKALGGQVSASGRFWRMRIGPFAARRDAEAALAKARRAGYSDARIQRAD